MLIFLLILYSMLEGSHTQRVKGRHRNTEYRELGRQQQGRHRLGRHQEGRGRHQEGRGRHQGGRDREAKDEPTPTSTPSVTHERNAGKCTENTCKMGDCHQVGDGIRICQCMRGYVGHRCSELMVNLADYVEAHPETKKKIKTFAEERDGGRIASSINQRLYHWSKKQIKKDEFAKRRAKQRQRANSEKVKSHQIVHSAFQIAFGDRGEGKQEPNSVNDERRDRGSERRGRSRSKRDIHQTHSLSPHLHSHLVLCIEDCQTVLSYSSQLCPDNKLAVELRIEESDWHHVPVNRVKCCTANVSDTCQEQSQPVLIV